MDTPYFDAHVHLASGYQAELPWTQNHEDRAEKLYMDEISYIVSDPHLLGAFLLTPTYFEGWAGHSLKSIIDENKIVLKSLNQVPLQGKDLRVLCGVYIRDPRAAQIAEACLSLQGIHGLKLRFSEPIEQWPENLDRVMAVAHRFKAIVLVHFSGPHYDSQIRRSATQGEPEQVQKLLKLMRESTDATLVIAHSGMDRFIGLDGLKTIGDYFKKHRNIRRNIFAEISFGFNQAEASGLSDPDYKKLVDAWKKFDLDFVLFGSDVYRRNVDVGGNPLLYSWVKKDTIKITEVPTLTKSEILKVLKNNYLNFFQIFRFLFSE